MFNKIGKKVAALLAAAAMLCGLAGCGKSEAGSSAVSGSSSEPQRVLAVASKFDFDEAVKNMTLFGQKISLPCYWSDFGADFSHDEMYIPSEDDLMCGLLYKEKRIGNIFFSDCTDAEDTDEVETHPIDFIILGFAGYGYPYSNDEQDYLETAGYYTKPLEFYAGELSMSFTKDDIITKLGEPSSISGDIEYGHWLYYDYDNGNFSFYINGFGERKGTIEELYFGVD